MIMNWVYFSTEFMYYVQTYPPLRTLTSFHGINAFFFELGKNNVNDAIFLYFIINLYYYLLVLLLVVVAVGVN